MKTSKCFLISSHRNSNLKTKEGVKKTRFDITTVFLQYSTGEPVEWELNDVSIFRNFFYFFTHTQSIFHLFSSLCFLFSTFLPCILFPMDVHSSAVILQSEWDGTSLYSDHLQDMTVTEGILKPSGVARIWFINLGVGFYFTFNIYSWKYNMNFILIFWLSFFLPASKVSVFQLLSHSVIETDLSQDYLYLGFQQSCTSFVCCTIPSHHNHR